MLYSNKIINVGLNEKKIDLDSTNYCRGLYIRAISSSKIYLGNLYQDMILNTQTNSYTKYSLKSECSMGSLCP